MEHRPVVLDETAIRVALSEIPLGGLRVFRSLGSTNDEALTWASEGAADLSLVVADEQTAGRGRNGREWLTPAGTAVAFSMILRDDAYAGSWSRLAGLGALAVTDACASLGLKPAIKWPNDVLLGGSKFAGILIEALWDGDRMKAAVMGIGINVLGGSAPAAMATDFPATSIEEQLGHRLNRVEILVATVAALISWRPRMKTAEFIATWEGRLAFRGQPVNLACEGKAHITGTVLGLDDDGSLRLMVNDEVIHVQAGEIHLRPTDDRMG